MTMKLFSSGTSPYARKIKVAAQELGIADQIEEIVTDPFGTNEEFLKANPLSKIPTLVTETGIALPDSSLILDYLAQKKSGLTALPRGARRWEILRRTQIAEGVMDAAVSCQLEKRRPESIHYIPHLDRQKATIRRALDVLNAEAGLLALQTPGLCEITVGCALGYLDFRLPYLEWRTGRDALASWYAVFAQRPSMIATQPKDPPPK